MRPQLLLAARAARRQEDGSWALAAALGSGQIVSWGVLYYAFAVFLTPMQSELGLTTAQLTGAFSLALAVSAVTGLAVGRWLDVRRPGPLMTAGSAAAVVCVLAWSRVDSLPELYLAFAAIGVVMATVLYEPAFVVITKAFSTRRREALTALTLIAACSSLIFSPLSEWLISTVGWRDALVALAVILGAVTVPLHAASLRSIGPPRRANPPVRDSATGREPPRRLPGFRLLTLSFSLATLATSSIAVLLVALLIAHGHTPGFAALVAGVVGISQIPGRIVFAVAGRWVSPQGLTVGAFVLMAAPLALLAIDHRTWAAIVFAVAFGMGAGMSTLLRASLLSELYGQAHYGRNASNAAALVTGTRAAAPLLAGAAVTLVGGYTALLWSLAGLNSLAAAAARRALKIGQADRGRPMATEECDAALRAPEP